MLCVKWEVDMRAAWLHFVGFPMLQNMCTMCGRYFRNGNWASDMVTAQPGSCSGTLLPFAVYMSSHTGWAIHGQHLHGDVFWRGIHRDCAEQTWIL
jgi:hypothetical protein